MRRISIQLPVYLPDWLYRALRRPKQINLLGDRIIEWSWIVSQMPPGPGEALDFGAAGSYLGLIAAQRGFSVTAVDLEPVNWLYVYPRLRFIQGDILELSLPNECKAYGAAAESANDPPTQINNMVLKVHYENEFPDLL